MERFRTPFGWQCRRASGGGVGTQTKVDLVESVPYLLGLAVTRLWREPAGVVVCGRDPRGQPVLVLFRNCAQADSARPRGSGNQITVTPALRPVGAELTAPQTAALREGAASALGGGPLHGAPMEDCAVALDLVELAGAASTGEALHAAAARAVGRALAAAGPVALHPVMQVEVVVPEDNLGAVLGDLQQRRALIQGSTGRDGTASIACEVPLAALLGYATTIRSLTRGRGQFTMQFERFDITGA